MNLPWERLCQDLEETTAAASGDSLRQLADSAWQACRHGDLDRWEAALDALPEVRQSVSLNRSAPQLGAPSSDPGWRTGLMALHPWRKGPLCLAGVTVDTEWRSDWKWDRLAPHVSLDGHCVLDIGCGNGYFGWRMLGAGASCVVGIDPTPLFVMQWRAQRICAGEIPNYVLPLRDTDLTPAVQGFDTVSSMGVLYHRREPEDHLQRLLRALRPGGQLILETLVLDQPGEDILVPEGRYARMRNVWSLPTPDRLTRSLSEAGFEQIKVVDVTRTTCEEQRSTGWMRFESLTEALDSSDPSLTLEGHPAPVRAIVLARRPPV